MSSTLILSAQEKRWLDGEQGKAMQLAMSMMATAADVSNATRFVPIEMAHIGSSFWTGQVSVDFAEFLLANDASFAVPTHTNASLIDCSTPALRPRARFPTEVDGAQRLMDIYTALGASQMWSCAPYAEPAGRPSFGTHVAGSESNAVSFFNSALGARTNKYGDFIDVCAAIVGRVPNAGLHTDEGRLATHVFDLADLDPAIRRQPEFPHLLGIIVGQEASVRVPVVVGLESATEEDLKAIAAAAATSGAVEMFHVVGITPEAPTLEVATAHREPLATTTVTPELLDQTRRRLSPINDGAVSAVCLGTPHFTVAEFAGLRECLSGRRVHHDVSVLVTTSRSVLNELKLRKWATELERAGVQIVLDTCTYYTPRAAGIDGAVMTNSAKWAYYAPGILGVDVAFGSLHDCVETAISGAIVRTDPSE